MNRPHPLLFAAIPGLLGIALWLFYPPNQDQPPAAPPTQHAVPAPQERAAQENATRGIDQGKRKANLKEAWKRLPDKYKHNSQQEAVRR